MASYCVNETQQLHENKEIIKHIKKFFDDFPPEQSDLDKLTNNDQNDERTTASGSSTNKRRKFTSIGRDQNKQSIPVPPLPRVADEMRYFQNQLPTWQLKGQILAQIASHQVTLITGGTGCGKTTQIPQFLLEQSANRGTPIRIYCTQPRRLPALAIAKRVAKERGEQLGDTVGYHIRLEQKLSPQSALIYCTSGVLLRKMIADELASDATHIILDEIHERELNTDYLLIILRQALAKRREMKLILMSATMEANLNMFLQYFRSCGIGHFNVPSRLFTVQCIHLAEVLILTDYLAEKEENDAYYVDSSASSQCTNFSSTQIGFSNGGFGQRPPPPYLNSPSQLREYNLSRGRGFGARGSTWAGRFATSTHIHQQENRTFENQAPSDSVFDSSSSFGLSSRAWSTPIKLNDEIRNIQAQLKDHFPDRPSIFIANYLPYLHTRMENFEANPLIEAYLAAGGRKCSDSVDKDLLIRLIEYIMDCHLPGGILVFLPGYEEINECYNRVDELWQNKKVRTKPVIFTLHSQLNTGTQQRVFDRVNAKERKVVLSTNIAEASLTINDIVFVIDCGRAKEIGYDSDTRIARLTCQWIAKSNAEQRKGRAGRCQPGYCFRLYTEKDYQKMLETQIPEMKRTAIHNVCLNAKMFAPPSMSVCEFLQQAPDPPELATVDQSMQFLEQIGALYTPRHSLKSKDFQFQPIPEPDMTKLGMIIAHLPLEPQLARLLLFGLAMKCFNPILTLVATMSYRDPFTLTIGAEQKMAAGQAKNEFMLMDYSDHLMLIRLVFAFNNEPNKFLIEQFCKRTFINEQSMWMIDGIKRQIFFELRRLNLLPIQMVDSHDHEVNKYSSKWPMIQAAIVFGTYPNIGYLPPGTTKYNKIRTTVGKNFNLHPTSSLRQQIKIEGQNFDSMKDEQQPRLEYFAFQEAISTSSRMDYIGPLSIRTVTAVPQLAILLFAGPNHIDEETIVKFELVDPDGYLSQKREQRLQEKLLKWEEERNKTWENMKTWRKELRKQQRKQQRQGKYKVFGHDIPEPKGSSSDNDDLEEEDENDGMEDWFNQKPPFVMAQEELFGLDRWFAFRGDFATLQQLIRLRLRIMAYFNSFINEPQRELSKKDEALLECVSLVLDHAHKESKFHSVNDLRASTLGPRQTMPIPSLAQRQYTNPNMPRQQQFDRGSSRIDGPHHRRKCWTPTVKNMRSHHP